MALSNKIMLSQIAGNIAALILSMCIFVPLIINISSFNGHCLLFTTGKWQEEDGLFDVQWASKIYCVFPILTGIFVFILSAIQIYRLSALVLKEEESSFLGMFFDVVVGISSCIMALISAVMITFGFIYWCREMNLRFPSCEVADGQKITKSDINISTGGFYTEMGTAQFGCWGSFATWVGLATFALLKLINNHQMRNLKVSMYLERQRLMNEDAFRENFSEPPVIEQNQSDNGSTD